MLTSFWRFSISGKDGKISAYMLYFTIHTIAAILRKPELVSRFIREITTW